MGTEQIDSVKNNQEKYKTYREIMGRLSKAIKVGFYYEAILIEYALIEDRLVSFLYHMGIIGERDILKMGKKRKKELKPILLSYNQKADNLRLKNISTKIMIVKTILLWASETTDDLSKNKYLKTLKSRCESVDVDGIVEILDSLDKWRDYRNEIIHCLMSKNTYSIDSTLKEQVLNGRDYARFLDAQLRIIKRGNVIRKAAKLKTG